MASTDVLVLQLIELVGDEGGARLAMAIGNDVAVDLAGQIRIVDQALDCSLKVSILLMADGWDEAQEALEQCPAAQLDHERRASAVARSGTQVQSCHCLRSFCMPSWPCW